jgi:hypothetical protein
MGQPLDDCGSRGAVIGVQEIEQGTGGGEPDRGRSRVVAVVFEDLAGFPDEVADAGGGDLQQVREDVHGAGLPLVEKSEQKARGVAEQRPGPRGSPVARRDRPPRCWLYRCGARAAHQVNPHADPVEIGVGAMCRRSAGIIDAGIVEPVDHQEIDPSVAPICRRRERAPGTGGWRPGSLDGCEDAWIFQ